MNRPDRIEPESPNCPRQQIKGLRNRLDGINPAGGTDDIRQAGRNVPDVRADIYNGIPRLYEVSDNRRDRPVGIGKAGRESRRVPPAKPLEGRAGQTATR